LFISTVPVLFLGRGHFAPAVIDSAGGNVLNDACIAYAAAGAVDADGASVNEYAKTAR